MKTYELKLTPETKHKKKTVKAFFKEAETLLPPEEAGILKPFEKLIVTLLGFFH